MQQIQTDRLILRRWRQEDRRPFAAMNADPAVTEHFPAPLTPAESDGLADVPAGLPPPRVSRRSATSRSSLA